MNKIKITVFNLLIQVTTRKNTSQLNLKNIAMVSIEI
jgi:hypothetical protein